jgi:hypothetical protein
MLPLVPADISKLATPGTQQLLSGIVVVALLLLLVGYELASTAGRRSRRLARHLIVAIAPLAAVFTIVVVGRLLAAH